MVNNVGVSQDHVFASHNVENEITESQNISHTKATGFRAGGTAWEKTEVWPRRKEKALPTFNRLEVRSFKKNPDPLLNNF